MTTNKKMRSRRRHRHKHTNKMLKKKDKKHNFSRRHRRHRNKTVSSWEKHYTYESDIDKSEVSKSNHNKDDNDVQAVHGLKDFLQGKKSTFK